MTTKGKGRGSSVESKEDQNMAEIRLQNPVWDLQLELDRATIPWNSTITEFQKEHAHYLAKALEQPLLLSKDIAALRNVRQLYLFLSLKRDLALVSFSACLTDIMLGHLSFI